MGNLLTGAKTAAFIVGAGEDVYDSPASAIVGGANITEGVVGMGEIDVFYGACGCNQPNGGIDGGFDYDNDDFFNGGAAKPIKSLRAYESSISSKLKNEVITRLARALKNVGIDVDPNDDPDKIIKDMKRNIPNPSKGKTFEADATSHEKICKAIAHVLNEQFTPGAVKGHEKLIDTNMGPVEICRKVGEWVHSFNIGVNTEFLAVHTSIQNAMRNILVLDAIMDRIFANIEDKIKNARTSDTNINSDTRAYRELYERAKQENLRQKLLLENMLNISLPPAMKELEIAMQEDNNYSSIIKKLNVKPGSTNFSDSIAYTISSLGASAAIAQKVDRALKQLGIKVNEYLDSKDFQKFSKMLKNKYKEVESGDLVNFIKAAEVLRKNFNNKNVPEFKKVLAELRNTDYKEDYPSTYESRNCGCSKTTGRGEMPTSLDYIEGGGGPTVKPVRPVVGRGEDTDDDTIGGEEIQDTSVDGGRYIDSATDTLAQILSEYDNKDESKIETRLEKIKKEKLIIIKDFVKRMAEHCGEFGKIVNKIGKMFGRDIPLSETTDELRNVVISLKDSDSGRVELFLIGYYSDARAREIKEKYLVKIKKLISIIDKLINKSEYKQFINIFKEFRDINQEIINTIEIYTDAVRKNVSTTFDSSELFGSAESAEITGGDKRDFNVKSINIDYDDLGPELSKSQYNLEKAISEFIYFYYISKVYKNLKNAATEVEEIGNNKYLEILGNSVAAKIEKLYKEKEKLLEKISDENVKKASDLIKKGIPPEYIRKRHIKEEDKELTEEIVNERLDKKLAYDYNLYGEVEYPFGFPEGNNEFIILNKNENIIKPDENSDPYILNIDDIVLPPRTYQASDIPFGAINPVSIGDIEKLYYNSTFNTINLKDQIGSSGILDKNNLRGFLLTKYQLLNLKTKVDPQLYGKFCFIAFLYSLDRPGLDASISPKTDIISADDNIMMINNLQSEGKIRKYRPNLKNTTLNILNRFKNYVDDNTHGCNARLLYGLGITPTHSGLSDDRALDLSTLINNISYCYDFAIKTFEALQEDKLSIFNDDEKFSSILITGGAGEEYDLINLVYSKYFINNPDYINHVKEVRKNIEKDFEVKINLYKVIQAIDIYLKEFTISIAKNPDAVKDISKILDGTQVIANWFNNDTGENLWKAFECMGSGSYSRLEYDNKDTYLTTLRDEVTLYHNPDRSNSSIIEETGEHYYDNIFKVFTKLNDNKFSHRHTTPTSEKNKHFKAIADPFIGVPCYNPTEKLDNARLSKKFLHKSIDNFQALKNLVNAFIRIGDEFGGIELRRKTFMSPNQIYKYLMDYIKQSAYFVNYNASENVSTMVPEYFMSFANATNEYNNFKEENQHFSAIIKAMSAKILVVLGVYDMFDRRQIITHLDPIRVIIGGDENVEGGDFKDRKNIDGKVIGIPEAAELYFRLPRIVEFYKKLLFWKGEGSVTDKISMIPEISGVFEGLVYTIFQKVFSAETGSYSEYDAKQIVHEINYIYNFYKNTPCNNEGGIVIKIILDLVKEVNQKIGIMKRDDVKKYWEMQKKIESRDKRSFMNTNITDYSILPDEGDYEESSGIAPHERYAYRLKDGTRNKNIKDAKDIERSTNLNLLNEFRTRLENIFNKFKPKNTSAITQLSYIKLIATAEKEMKKTQNASEKLNTAIKLIQTTKELNVLADKAFMFHETVISGLNALGTIYDFIATFRDTVKFLNPVELEIKIIEYFAEGGVLDTLPCGDLNSLDKFSDIQRKFIYKRSVDKYGNPIVENGVPRPIQYLSERMLLNENQPSTSVDMLMYLLDDENFIKFSDKNNLQKLFSHADYNINVVKTYYEENTMPEINRDKVSFNKETNMLDYDESSKLFIRLRTIARYLVDYPLMMKLFLESVYGITNNELIKVKILKDSYSPIQLDFSELVTTVEGLIDDIKFYFNKFRSYLNDDLLKIFEDVDTIGSIYWFEKEFIDILFKGLGKVTDEKEGLSTWDVDSLNEIIKLTNSSFLNLTRNTKVSLKGVNIRLRDVSTYSLENGIFTVKRISNSISIAEVINNILYSRKKEPEDTKEPYGNVMSELIYYNNTSFREGEEYDCMEFPTDYTYHGPYFYHIAKTEINGSKRHARIEQGIEKFLIEGRVLETTKQDKNENAFKFKPLKYSGRFHIWDKTEITEQKSLLFSFNQLFAMYLSSNVDNMNNKIYANLINTFANGTASKSVFNPENGAFPDLCSYGSMFGRRGDPQCGMVLLSSLAHVVHRIITDINTKTQAPDFLIGTLSDVPSYMKEKYRNNLYYTSKLFDTLLSKCEFYENIIVKSSANWARSAQNLCDTIDTTTGNDTYNPMVKRRGTDKKVISSSTAGFNSLNEKQLDAICELDNGLSSEEIKIRLPQLISSIVEHALVVKTMSDEVIQELGGENPRYMETYTNFIETYKNRYNKHPLMPLSHSLYVTKENICYQGSKNIIKSGTVNSLTKMFNRSVSLMFNEYNKDKNPETALKTITFAEMVDVYIKSSKSYIEQVKENSNIYKTVAEIINAMCGTGKQSANKGSTLIGIPDESGYIGLAVGEKAASIRYITKTTESYLDRENDMYIGINNALNNDKQMQYEWDSNVTGFWNTTHPGEHSKGLKTAYMTGYVDLVYNLGFKKDTFTEVDAQNMFTDICYGGHHIKNISEKFYHRPNILLARISRNICLEKNNLTQDDINNLINIYKLIYLLGKLTFEFIKKSLRDNAMDTPEIKTTLHNKDTEEFYILAKFEKWYCYTLLKHTVDQNFSYLNIDHRFYKSKEFLKKESLEILKFILGSEFGIYEKDPLTNKFKVSTPITMEWNNLSFIENVYDFIDLNAICGTASIFRSIDEFDETWNYCINDSGSIPALNNIGNVETIKTIFKSVNEDSRFLKFNKCEYDNVQTYVDSFKNLHMLFEFINKDTEMVFNFCKFSDIHTFLNTTCVHNCQLPTMDSSELPSYIFNCYDDDEMDLSTQGNEHYGVDMNYTSLLANSSIAKIYNSYHGYTYGATNNTHCVRPRAPAFPPRSNIISIYRASIIDPPPNAPIMFNGRVENNTDNKTHFNSKIKYNKSLKECNSIKEKYLKSWGLAKIYLFYNLVRPIQKKIIESYVIKKGRDMLGNTDDLDIVTLWDYNEDKKIENTPNKIYDHPFNINNDKNANLILFNYELEEFTGTGETKPISGTLINTLNPSSAEDVIGTEYGRMSMIVNTVSNPFIEKFMTYLNASTSTLFSKTAISTSLENRAIANHLYMSTEGVNYSCIDTLRFCKHLLSSESFNENIKRVHDSLIVYNKHRQTPMLIGHFQHFNIRNMFQVLESFIYNVIHGSKLYNHDLTLRLSTYKKFIEHIIHVKFPYIIFNADNTQTRLNSRAHPHDVDMLDTDLDVIDNKNYERFNEALKYTLKYHIIAFTNPNNSSDLPDMEAAKTAPTTAVTTSDPREIFVVPIPTSTNPHRYSYNTRSLYPEISYLIDCLYKIVYFNNELIDKVNNVRMKFMLLHQMRIFLNYLNEGAFSNMSEINQNSDDPGLLYARRRSRINITTRTNINNSPSIYYLIANLPLEGRNYLYNALKLTNRLSNLFVDVRNSSFGLSERLDEFVSSILLQNYCRIEKININIIQNLYSCPMDSIAYQVVMGAANSNLGEYINRSAYVVLNDSNIYNGKNYPISISEAFSSDQLRQPGSFKFRRDKEKLDMNWKDVKDTDLDLEAIYKHNGGIFTSMNLQSMDNLTIYHQLSEDYMKNMFTNTIIDRFVQYHTNRIKLNLDLMDHYCIDFNNEKMYSFYKKLNKNYTELIISSSDFDKYVKHIKNSFECSYIALINTEKLRKSVNELPSNADNVAIKQAFSLNGYRYLPHNILAGYYNPDYDDESIKLFLTCTDDSKSNGVFYTQDNLFKLNNVFGTTESKIQYSLRAIINSTEVSYDKYPSIKEFINKYNDTILSANKIDTEKYLEFMKKMVSIVRYNLDCRNFKSYVQTDFWSGIDLQNVEFNDPGRPCPKIVINDPNVIQDTLLPNFTRIQDSPYNSKNVGSYESTGLKPQMISYGFNWKQRAYNIIFSIENSNQEEEINKINKISSPVDEGSEYSRMTECINNLLDLNIMPININVLMTEIPLINLYNYEYTFELMTAAMYGKDHKNMKEKDKFKAPDDTQSALLTLLYHPYMPLKPGNGMYLGNSQQIQSYYEYISRIMRGDNNLGLSRPKFLSDQLFNKVLLRSIYPSPYAYDEAGAAVSSGIYRGYSNYNAFDKNTTDGMRPVDNTSMTYQYLDPVSKNFRLRSRSFDPTTIMYLDFIGRKRFDTTIIRNLFFIVNVLRITRLKLNRELSSDRNVVVNSHFAVAPGVTEYGVDPFNPNEEYGSKTKNNYPQFNNNDLMDMLPASRPNVSK